MSKEAMKLAPEALENHAPLTGKNAITALREALVEQPAKQDIPDLIAGTLGVSRGTAYDLMREALAEQPAPVQEPLTPDQVFAIADQHPVEGFDPENMAFARAIEAAHGIGEKK